MMNWIALSPELWMLATIGVFLGRSMMRPDAGRDHLLALVTSAVALGVALAGTGFSGELFAGTYRVDLFSQFYKCLLAAGFFLVVCLCDGMQGVREDLQAEFYLLLAVCTLAMMMLVSSVHLLTLYITLELSSYSLYILVSLRRNRARGIRAGLKYFLVGAAASAVMLFGLALVYGTTGTAYLIDLLAALPVQTGQPAFSIGLLLLLGGFLFKLAIFPFHVWAPDVYEGAANPVAAYIATASKVAAVGILVRLAVLGTTAYFVHVLAVLAIASMTIGNLAAITQTDFKRLLAYSSVAQGGYILIGILSMDPAGYAAATFYAFAVLVMKFTCFMVVVQVAAGDENPTLADLAGLHRHAPVMAMALMMALFGLGGIPPTIGFTGKLLLFTAAMAKGHFTLVLIAMINVVISLYYYLKVLRAAYFLEPSPEAPQVQETLSMKALSLAMIAAMVVIGFYPNHLIELTRRAAALIS
jgi:NADH-quinone oxidoreductase subunit N